MARAGQQGRSLVHSRSQGDRATPHPRHPLGVFSQEESLPGRAAMRIRLSYPLTLGPHHDVVAQHPAEGAHDIANHNTSFVGLDK